MLAQNFTRRGPGHVHGNIAAANDNYFLTNRELVAQIHVEQEIDAFVNSVQINSGNGQVAAAMRAHRDQHRVKTLPPQIGNREIFAGGVIELKGNVSGRDDFAHLRFNHIARQSVLRNSEVKHAARNRSSFKNCDCVAHQSEVMRRGKSDRPASHDRDFEGQFLLGAPDVNVYGVLGFGAVTLGEKTFQSSNGNRTVNLTPAARGLARMRANTAANRGQWIGIAGELIGLLKAAFGNQSHITPGIGVGRTGHHARKVCVEPVAIDFLGLEALEHGGGSATLLFFWHKS